MTPQPVSFASRYDDAPDTGGLAYKSRHNEFR